MSTEALIDILWILLCAGFVFLMQGGFLCLESGVTRTKNSINVAVKNIVDFGLAVFLYWAVAYGLMFGTSAGGWLGTSGWFFTSSGEDAPFQYSVFIFQAMFCATGATIISGATAERIKFGAYLLITGVFSILVYPFVGHWVWATDFLGDPAGWLSQRGFLDFAGSTVVHSTGGWVSLALLIIVGARAGRFDENGKPVEIPGSNMPMAMLGATLLVFGWFGFNGGSTLTFSDAVPLILMNTLLGAVAGTAAVLTVIPVSRRLPDPGLLMNGAIAGLVGVTANCNITGPVAAFVIGLVAGGIMLVTVKLLERLQIDDAVGAIPAHLTPGIWGTLAVAFFADAEVMGLDSVDRMEMFTTQLIGVVVVGFWSFCLAFLFFWILNKIYPFRVSLEDEVVGLNVSEHNARTETVFLLEDMEMHARTGDLSKRVREEPFTEIGQIARQYNKVINSLDLTMNRLKAIFRDLNDGLVTFDKEGKLLEINPAALKFFGIEEPQTAEGISAWDLLVPEEREDLQVHQRSDQEAFDPFRTGVMQEIHYVRKNSRKDEVVEFVSSKGVYNEEEVYTGLIRDITETVQVKRSRSRLVSKLFGAQQSGFFASMCRQSLPVMESLAARIENTVAEFPPTVGSHSDRIDQDAREILSLTKDLVHVDKEGVLPVKPVNFSEFLDESIDSINNPEFETRDIALETAESPLRVALAPQAFLQAFETLLVLACRECPADGTVTVKTHPVFLDHPKTGTEVLPAGEYYLLTIHDGGAGLTDAELDDYFAGQSRKHKDLDVVNADMLIRHMNGVLDVDSMVDFGTTIAIYLPIHRRERESADLSEPLAKVLVVDDHMTQADLFEAVLAEAGYESVLAANMDAAIKILEEQEVDAVLLDLVLGRDSEPNQQLYSYIRETYGSLPVIAMSGEVNPQVVSDLVQDGAAGFLAKPLNLENMIRLLRRELAVAE